MKTYYFILIVLWGTCSLQSQDYSFIKNTSFDWKDYETNISDEEMIDVIKKNSDNIAMYIPIDKIFPSEAMAKIYPNLLDDFHYIDFNGDGEYDIVYSGPDVIDGGLTVIYEMENNRCIGSSAFLGAIIKLWTLFPGSPYSFATLNYPYSPPDVLRVIDVYVPVYEVDQSLEYKLSFGLNYIEHTKFPLEMDLHIPFEVKNDNYKLRFSPAIDDNTEFFYHGKPGNTIGLYTPGSRGIALAEETDETGRVWWFVIMLNNKYNDIYYQDNERPIFYSLGWMSSRFLDVNDF